MKQRLLAKGAQLDALELERTAVKILVDLQIVQTKWIFSAKCCKENFTEFFLTHYLMELRLIFYDQR